MEIEEIKNRGIKLVGFMLIIFIFIILPLEKNLNLKKDIELNKKRLQGYQEKINIINSKIMVEADKEQMFMDNNKIKNNKIYKFGSKGEINLYIDKYAEIYNLEIAEIGRVIENNGKAVFSYKVNGNKEEILSFLLDIEKNNKIFILNHTLEIKKIKNILEAHIDFEGVIEKGYINKNKEINNPENKNIDFNKNIKFINDTTGIIEVNNKKYYIKNTAIIKINEKKYDLKIEKRKVIIKERV